MTRERLDELIGEIFTLYVYDLGVCFFLLYLIRDGVEQMCFAEPGRTVNEKRVVVHRGCRRDRRCRSMGKAVGISDYEIVECILEVEGRHGRADEIRLFSVAALLGLAVVIFKYEHDVDIKAQYLRKAPSDLVYIFAFYDIVSEG